MQGVKQSLCREGVQIALTDSCLPLRPPEHKSWVNPRNSEADTNALCSGSLPVSSRMLVGVWSMKR